MCEHSPRFYAALIDIALLLPILLVGYYVIIRAILDLDEGLGNWLAALAGIATFALQWGYYMIFEIATNGQSPGKRVLGLRVIKAQGYPISFSDSAIRNIVRIVDMLPFAYGVGLLTMLLNKNWQRLGDLAAGTLVVKEDAKASPPSGEDADCAKADSCLCGPDSACTGDGRRTGCDTGVPLAPGKPSKIAPIATCPDDRNPDCPKNGG